MDQLGNVVQLLDNKTLIITGACGFLAKLFLEKILRMQPNVKKVFLIIRGADNDAAIQRFHKEVVENDVFIVLKEKWGENLKTFISEKVSPMAGDISVEDLAIKDHNLKEEMWRDIDIVVNLAATLDFDERYDAALATNTMGAKHVLNFAKKCVKLKMFLHVSTAFVSGEKGGVIEEKSFCMGETLNGTSKLDIDAEIKLAKEKISELRSEKGTEAEVNSAIKDFGIARARAHGWANTYVFTKAMGEMVLGHFKDDGMPLVIVRPTIVTCTYEQPFPGWVEGLRTIDSLAVAYGKGRLACFLGDPTLILDVIPADHVVNLMVLSIAAHWQEPCQIVYHVASSVRNPMKVGQMQEVGYRYFSKHPWIDKEGKPIKVGKVKILNSMSSFQSYMAIRYLLLLKVLQFLSVFSNYFNGIYTDLNRKIKGVMRLVDLYEPFLFFKSVFDDMNMEKLQIAAKESGVDMDIYYMDPKGIDWDDYFVNIHLPAIAKYVFKK